MEKGFGIEEIMRVKMKLGKLKIPTTVLNTIKKSIISKKVYASHFKTQKILRLIEDLRVNKSKQRSNSVYCQFKTHNAVI